MRLLCLLLILATSLAAFGQDSSKESKLKVEGEAPNHQALVQKLNMEGADHGMKFALANLDFDYRVTLITTQSTTKTGPGGAKMNVASATVYDAKGKKLFQFEQDGSWSDPGGAGAAAKQIVKEFVKLGIAGAK